MDNRWKYGTANPESFVYFRAGDYQMDANIDDNGDDGMRLVYHTKYKPGVWIAYPGDARPVVHQDIAHLWFIGSHPNLWLDGFHFKSDGNARSMGMNIGSNKSNVVIRRNIYSGITGGTRGGNNGLIMFRKQGSGTNYMIQENEFRDVDVGFGIISYQIDRALVEDNYFHDIGATTTDSAHALGMKYQSTRWNVRGNRFRNNSSFSVWQYDGGSDGNRSGYHEISYNVVEAGGGRFALNQRYEAIGHPVHAFRNTILDKATQGNVTATNGPYYWYNNVIVNDNPELDKISKKNILVPERLIIENNLTGSSADGITDAQGNLTAAYAEYIGVRGHQLVSPPSSIVLTIDR